MPTHTEWQDYRQLTTQVLVVTASFLLMGLALALAADVLPTLLHL